MKRVASHVSLKSLGGAKSLKKNASVAEIMTTHRSGMSKKTIPDLGSIEHLSGSRMSDASQRSKSHRVGVLKTGKSLKKLGNLLFIGGEAANGNVNTSKLLNPNRPRSFRGFTGIANKRLKRRKKRPQSVSSLFLTQPRPR